MKVIQLFIYYLKRFNKKYKAQLQKKILNIFIQNSKAETVYSYYNDKDFLIELTAISFFNNLIEEKLLLDWEKNVQ